MGLTCGLLGLVCLGAFEFTGAHVDPDGHLHEAFALQALGMLCWLVAALTEVVHGAWRFWHWICSLMA